MIRGGTDIAVGMRISGHRTRSTFDRYNIVSTDDLRAAVTRTAAHVASLPTERNVVGMTANSGNEHGQDTDNPPLAGSSGFSAVVVSQGITLGGLAEAGGNRTHRSGGQPGAGRL